MDKYFNIAYKTISESNKNLTPRMDFDKIRQDTDSFGQALSIIQTKLKQIYPKDFLATNNFDPKITKVVYIKKEGKIFVEYEISNMSGLKVTSYTVLDSNQTGLSSILKKVDNNTSLVQAVFI